MKEHKLYYTFRFIYKAFKEILYLVQHGITNKRGWLFTTPHGTWTLTLDCEESLEKPVTDAATHPFIILDDPLLRGAYV